MRTKTTTPIKGIQNFIALTAGVDVFWFSRFPTSVPEVGAIPFVLLPVLLGDVDVVVGVTKDAMFVVGEYVNSCAVGRKVEEVVVLS